MCFLGLGFPVCDVGTLVAPSSRAVERNKVLQVTLTNTWKEDEFISVRGIVVVAVSGTVNDNMLVRCSRFRGASPGTSF